MDGTLHQQTHIGIKATELKQQIIRNRWHTVELEKVVDKIHNRQQS
jgi:CCR4-NOT transcriptional regulation complex NOT5 subunit